MLNKKLVIVIMMLLMNVGFAMAQDMHFTQFNASPLTLNPAMSGFFSGSQRFALSNKNQWRSVTAPFRSVSASMDMPVIKRYLKHDLFGAGIVVNRDQAGDSKFGTTQANLSFSYIRSVNRINNEFFSFGIQAGAAQRTIDYANLMFDSQYDGNSYNPALSNNETFSGTNFFFFDLSAGAYWHMMYKNKTDINAGVAVFHINSPHQSLLGNQDIRLDRKIVFHADSKMDVYKRTAVIPSILLMKQGTYFEMSIGSIVKYVKTATVMNYTAVSFGTYFRVGDAINFVTGLDYKTWSLGLSYDVNVSKLTPASHAKGGFELSLIYILKKAQQYYAKKIPCPIF
jgi:type IX secretion system PorP/SprF family membrane protein